MIEFDALAFLLGAPLLGGAVLALVGHRDRARDINVAFSAATFIAACVLTVQVFDRGPLLLWGHEFYIDALNVFLVTLTAFVGLTTAIFSRPYMRVERDLGKMTPPRLRLYHSMYQLFSFTMLLALTTNNLGIVWVAMEAATLTTVLLVSVYRTAASLEAAWKYFILCGVGIAQALFGTVLLYMAAERSSGPRAGRCYGPTWTRSRPSSTRTSSRWPLPSCSSATAPRWAWCRCTTGCPTRTPKARRRCRPYSPACC
jgi:hydrogenase-4 component F